MVWDLDIGPGDGTVSRKDTAGLMLKLQKKTKANRHGGIRVRIGTDLLRATHWQEGDGMRLAFNREERRGLIRRVKQDERGWTLRGNGVRKVQEGAATVSLYFSATTTVFPDDLRATLTSICENQFFPGDVHVSEEGIIFSYAPVDAELQHSGA